MTKYVTLKRDLYENPGHRGYTGIRDKAGVWSIDEISCCTTIKEEYDPDCRDSYAIPLEAAPEFTNECFHDLSIAHLRAKIKNLLDAAEAVCWFDWSSNDKDAVSAIDRLRAMVKEAA